MEVEIEKIEPVDPVELYITENIKTFDDFKGSKRVDGEDFEVYKIRRKAEKLVTKIYLQGRYPSQDGKPVE